VNPTRQLVRSLPALVAALLLLSTALLVLGVIVENHGSGSENPSASASETAGHRDTEGHAEGGSDEHAAEPSTHTESANETVLGVRTESPGAVTAAAIVSVALAGFLWRRPTRWVSTAVALFAAGATALDLTEISHQTTDNRGDLAVLAAVIALAHLGVVIGAVILWRQAGTDHSQLRPATS
jgi:hypothetical protein